MQTDWDTEWKRDYKEDERGVAIARVVGGCCCIFMGAMAFVTTLAYIPVNGITEVPTYARTLLYMSLGCVLCNLPRVTQR